MADSSSSVLLQILIRLSEPLKESLSKTDYTPPETYAHFSIKSKLLSLLPEPTISDADFPSKVKDFALCCAALASASNSATQHLSWLPTSLSIRAGSALEDFSDAYYDDSVHAKCSMKVGELELDFSGVVENEKKLLIELMPELLPLLKDTIKESAIDAKDENDGVSAASARAPVAYAVLAAYQLRWIVEQMNAPYIGKLCHFMIPCSLVALDHWSPEVKGQGMISFTHLAKTASAAEIGGYADAILDACCQNIASDDEIWHYVVEMSVLLIALLQKNNPHSTWYEKLLGEMLNHLERQPRNKQRRVVWLTHCEPLLDGLGLVLLAHFRRLFPLFFKWLHADDDETVLLVLERLNTVVRLTWIRNSPHIERLVDELVTLYKDAALKVAREDIRSLILQILKLIQVEKTTVQRNLVKVQRRRKLNSSVAILELKRSFVGTEHPFCSLQITAEHTKRLDYVRNEADSEQILPFEANRDHYEEKRAILLLERSNARAYLSIEHSLLTCKVIFNSL